MTVAADATAVTAFLCPESPGRTDRDRKRLCDAKPLRKCECESVGVSLLYTCGNRPFVMTMRRTQDSQHNQRKTQLKEPTCKNKQTPTHSRPPSTVSLRLLFTFQLWANLGSDPRGINYLQQSTPNTNISNTNTANTAFPKPV